MNTSFAKVLSGITHPLLMPTWLCTLGIIFMPELFPYSESTRVNILLLVFLATFLIPAVPLGVYFRVNFPESLEQANFKDRLISLVICTVIYFIVFLWFHYIGLRDNFVSSIVGASLLNAWFCAFFSLFYRPSLHAAGASTLVMFILYFQFINPDFQLLSVMSGAIILSGLIWSARLALDAHDYFELIMGATTGVVSSAMTFYLIPVV